MVCAYNILHLVPDRQAALARIMTVLRPGGSLVSSTPCLRESWVPFGLVLPVMRWFGKAPPVTILGIPRLEADLRAAGFVDLRTPDIGASKHTAFVLATKPA